MVSVRRRELLSGIAAAGVLGGGVLFAAGGVDPFSDDESVVPVELETIDAPGSEAGTISIPDTGDPTFVEFFATWCPTCASTMSNTAEIYADFGDEYQFVSVTNEPVGRTTTRADVATWWEEHGGEWTVALDSDLELTTQLGVNGVPHSVVLDGGNTIVWSEYGYKSTADLREPIQSVPRNDE